MRNLAGIVPFQNGRAPTLRQIPESAAFLSRIRLRGAKTGDKCSELAGQARNAPGARQVRPPARFLVLDVRVETRCSDIGQLCFCGVPVFTETLAIPEIFMTELAVAIDGPRPRRACLVACQQAIEIEIFVMEQQQFVTRGAQQP